jgi:hypothetical protein
MEEQLVADRSHLRRLLLAHPDWSYQEYVDQIGRPHQGKPCGNRPPRVAFPELPVRPAVPLWVDPDQWVQAIDGEHYARKVGPDGCVKLGERRYYVQKGLAGRHIVLEIDAPTCELVVWYRKEVIKHLSLKGLTKTLVAFDDFVDQMLLEARSAWRHTEAALRTRRQRSWASG